MQKIDEVGLDLEYAKRAWCALERCYLVSRDSFHKDTRLLRLVPLLKELVKEM